MERRKTRKKIYKTFRTVVLCLLAWAYCVSFRTKSNSLEINASFTSQLEINVIVQDKGKLCFGYNCALLTAFAVLSLHANTRVLIISHCPTGAPSVFADLAGVSFICYQGLLSGNAQTVLASTRSEYIFFAQPGDLPVVPSMKAHVAQIRRKLRHQVASQGAPIMKNMFRTRAIARRESAHTFTYWMSANADACDSAWMKLPSIPCHWTLSEFVAFLQFIRAAAFDKSISDFMPSSYLDAISDVLMCGTGNFPIASEKVLGMFCEVLGKVSVVPRHAQQAAQMWSAHNCNKYTSKKTDVCFIIPFLSDEISSVTLSDLLRDLALVDVAKEVILVHDCKSHGYGSALAQNYASVLEVTSSLFGAGGARNFGTNFCAGDYVMYIDADDKVDSECLADSIRMAISEHTDVMFLPYTIVQIKQTGLVVDNMWSQDRDVLKHNISLDLKLLQTIPYPWTKLMKRSIILSIGDPFTHTRVHNDMSLHWYIHRKANKFTFGKCTVVTHIKSDTSKSISTLRNEERYDALTAFQLLMDEFCLMNTSDVSCSQLMRTIKSSAKWNMKRMSDVHQDFFREGLDALLQVRQM